MSMYRVDVCAPRRLTCPPSTHARTRGDTHTHAHVYARAHAPTRPDGPTRPRRENAQAHVHTTKPPHSHASKPWNAAHVWKARGMRPALQGKQRMRTGIG